MFDTYILDDIDSFEPESNDLDYNGEELDDTHSTLLDSLDEFITSIENVPIDDMEQDYSLFTEEENIDTSNVSSHSHQPSFTGRSLGWNGRCRVCSCGKWAGFGDTCANCGHFYNQHI